MRGSPFESGAALLELLLTEKCDPEIQTSDTEVWIGRKSFLKIFLCFRAFLLVQESYAKGVQTQSFRRSSWAGSGRRLRGFQA